MKHINQTKLISAALFIVFIFFSTATIRAQQLQLGGGFGYGTTIKNAGLDFRAELHFDSPWAIAPHFTWFFNKEGNLQTSKWNALNIDVHYLFDAGDQLQIYPIGGLNVATVTTVFNRVKFSNTYGGLNLGGGVVYKINDKFTWFGEMKYVVSDADQAVFSTGVLFAVGL